MVTYFFCAMHQALGTGTLNYLHGTLLTTADPATKEGLDEITANIAREFTPPAERIILIAFNRL